MVRLNRRVGYNRDTYLLCRLCDRVAMIPEQVRRKLDVGQGHIVGQVAVHFPVEPVFSPLTLSTISSVLTLAVDALSPTNY